MSAPVLEVSNLSVAIKGSGDRPHVLLGGAPLPLAIVSSLYVMARLLQGYAQVRALQPQRMIFYLAGVAATFALVVLIAARSVI